MEVIKVRMPSQFQYDCPHCQTKAAGFVVQYQWSDRTSNNIASVLGVCGVCNNCIVLKVRNIRGSSVADYVRNAEDFPREYESVFEVYPRIIGETPADCPPSVDRFYRQGIVNLRGENWDAAGAMFRKALDVATKFISPEKKRESLFVRINALVTEGLLTPAMGDWSHELRIDGNEAVHDEEPETEEDAIAMQKFAEAFLRYAFTLPSLVAQNRAKRDGES
jgi:hypothetical protein